MDIIMLVGAILFALLILSWMILPHTKMLAEGSVEFSQIADEGNLVKA